MLSLRLALILCLSVAIALPALAQTSGNTATVRVIHVSPDAPAVDVWVDGTLTFQGLQYKDFTNHTPVPAGNHDLQITISGTTTAVLGGLVNLSPDADYSFYAMGRVNAMEGEKLILIGVGDDLSAPSGDSVKVRVVHAAPSAPLADVYVTAPFAPLPDTPLLSAVPFTLGTGYVTAPAGTYQARVTPAGSKTVAINSGRVELKGGTVRSVVALDPASEGAPFEFLILPDRN